MLRHEIIFCIFLGHANVWWLIKNEWIDDAVTKHFLFDSQKQINDVSFQKREKGQWDLLHNFKKHLIFIALYKSSKHPTKIFTTQQDESIFMSSCTML